MLQVAKLLPAPSFSSFSGRLDCAYKQTIINTPLLMTSCKGKEQKSETGLGFVCFMKNSTLFYVSSIKVRKSKVFCNRQEQEKQGFWGGRTESTPASPAARSALEPRVARPCCRQSSSRPLRFIAANSIPRRPALCSPAGEARVLVSLESPPFGQRILVAVVGGWRAFW